MRKKVISTIILLLAILFLAIGCVRGEPGVVLGKAINICLECIGLG